MKSRKNQPLRNSVHDQTIKQMMDIDPSLKRGNFFRECFAAFPDIEEIKEYFKNHPDIYSINKADETVTIIEVEDYSKLSESKLVSYGQLWGALDFNGVELLLFVVDRYGNNKSPIDLCHWYYYALDHYRKPVTCSQVSLPKT